MPNQRRVITIATGKKLYVDLATNLARSFLLWHRQSDIKFQLVTDLPDLIPADISQSVEIISVKKGELGEGFSTKLWLDKLVSQGRTLFIDSDCLVYRNLDFVFDRFEGHAVSVVGGYLSTGEWFGDVSHICRRFSIKRMPKFNGGVYYLEKSGTATKIFDTARLIEKEYDEAGFVRLRNRPNDEVIISVAMEVHSETPIPDDGSIMAEFVNFKSGVKSNLLNGVAELYNDPRHKDYQPNWPLTLAKPAIVHFLGHHTQILPYVKEAQILKYVSEQGMSERAARVVTFLKTTTPRMLATGAKNIFRPLYHKIFGIRAIQKSERIID